MATGYGLDLPGLISGRGKLFSLLQRVHTGPGANQWVTGAHFAELKQQECEAGHSLPSNAEDKNGRAMPPLPIRLYGVVLNYS
jgi:hypothetical protein